MRLKPETVAAVIVWTIVVAIIGAVIVLAGALTWFFKTFISIR